VELVVLVHLVVLVVIFIFFSLFLQFVLLQRIMDIYVCILRKNFFVSSDVSTTTWRFGLSGTHIRWFKAHHKQNPLKKKPNYAF
jgi:hypothetical protein